MNPGPVLSKQERALLCAVFVRHRDVVRVDLFGSRADGTARPESDIDLAVYGLADSLSVEALADELDELPLPYKFDVVSAEALSDGPLREEIAQTGVTLYERRRPDAPSPSSF